MKRRLFQRADSNDDGSVDISDAIGTLFFLFQGTVVTCRDAADADDNGTAEVTDAIYVLQYLFLNGPPPPAPFPACGVDPTADNLAPCVRQPGCL